MKGNVLVAGAGYGIVGIGIAAFIDWNIYKLILRRLLLTSVTVDDEGVRVRLFGDEPRDMPWTEVRLAGLATAPRRLGRSARHLFVVDRRLDQMLSFSAAYARFGEMAAAVRARAPSFFEIDVDADETLRHRLLRLALRDVTVDDDGIRFALVGDEPIAVASPDVGGVKRAQLWREALEATLGRPVAQAFVDKRRAAGVVSGGDLVTGEVGGATVLIVDDSATNRAAVSRRLPTPSENSNGRRNSSPGIPFGMRVKGASGPLASLPCASWSRYGA